MTPNLTNVKQKATTQVKKARVNEFVRERIQTRATTAKAKTEIKVTRVTEEGKNKIRRSLFTSAEDIRQTSN